ncbi:hypothetical protein ACFWZY_06480 [Streptomyces sp. NPDC058992]|uniref:hypothetical protein n=1 Tax=Streptomyces sp. NPDC058992 TaxID=3346688 RepID=UPI0036A5C936
MSTRDRLLAGLGAAALALALGACGSGADTEDSARGSSAAAGATGDSASQDSKNCPDKHSATVEDTEFGGTAEIELCALPEIHKTAVEADWTPVHEGPTEATPIMNIMPVVCDGDDDASCKEIRVGANDTCGGTPLKPNCHPLRGDKVSVVCSGKDRAGNPIRWYGVLLDSKRVVAEGTSHDTGLAGDFTDKGDKPIGYIAEKDLAKVSADLPACDGTMLHGNGARARALMEGLPLED